MVGLVSLVLSASLLVAGASGIRVEELGAPAPAETLRYDDGSPESYQSLGDFMCEKMPVPLSTPYPFNIVAVLWNTSLTGAFTLQIWDDDGPTGLPGTVIHSQAVSPPGSGWFEIILSSPVQIADGQFYVGCATVQGIGFDETNPDFDESYVDVGLGYWEPFWYYGPNGDFLIRAVIEPMPPQNDAGVSRIIAPDTLIEPLQAVAPEVWVRNFGTLPQDTVPVWCVIDSSGTGVYSEVDTLYGLASEDSSLALFPAWTPDGGGNTYDLTVFTALAGDEDPANDTLYRTVTTMIHDCGIDTIIEPPDTVYVSEGYYPVALVRNYGNADADLDVMCQIGSFVDTASLANLSPGSARACTFALWQVPLSDSTYHDMIVTAMLAGDLDPLNDTLSKSIFAYNPHDVGVVEKVNPPDTVNIGGYPVEVAVRNWGEVEDSLLVKCTIEPHGYSDSVFVYGLAAGQVDTVSLADWDSWPPNGEVCFYVWHPLDRNSANDSLCDSVFVVSGTQEEGSRPHVYSFRLFGACPSPFFRETRIVYQVPSRDGSRTVEVCLAVYDASGKLVRRLVQGPENPGNREVTWDGKSDAGKDLPAGIYFCRLEAEGQVSTRKAVLLR